MTTVAPETKVVALVGQGTRVKCLVGVLEMSPLFKRNINSGFICFENRVKVPIKSSLLLSLASVASNLDSIVCGRTMCDVSSFYPLRCTAYMACCSSGWVFSYSPWEEGEDGWLAVVHYEEFSSEL